MFMYAVRQVVIAMRSSDEHFYKLFGVNRPDRGDHIVFSCLMGARSNAARLLVERIGYERCEK